RRSLRTCRWYFCSDFLFSFFILFSSGGAEKNVVIEMPKDAFQERHNQFIDAIFARINRIVSDSYDPFKVRLASLPMQPAKPQKSNTPSKSTKTSTKSKTKKVSSGTKARSMDTEAANSTTVIKSDMTSNVEEVEPASASSATSVIASSSVTDVKQKQQQKQKQKKQKPQTVSTESVEKRTVPSLSSSSSPSKNKKTTQPLRSNTNKQTTKQQKPKQTSSNLSASPSASAASPSSVSAKPAKSAPASTSMEKLRGAEGSLSGLASLRRVGNAKVVTDPEGRNSTIKSKFTLGPLTLKVEKSFKRGNVRNVKTATARTNEMIGRIKFSVVNDQATLVSIKVQQPKQVEIESKDNHDRTREMVWRRTPKIARLVSEKLRLAAESLFQPRAGVEVVRL
ncbi:uncharacterized protein LOC129945259, partial [Eupeodes corollae]|uniref:uncharacterized protein LOC129945259 n=1 Tax=Eupeodes corollae TaxID=290404 RepID=UPI00249062A7